MHYTVTNIPYANLQKVLKLSQVKLYHPVGQITISLRGPYNIKSIWHPLSSDPQFGYGKTKTRRGEQEKSYPSFRVDRYAVDVVCGINQTKKLFVHVDCKNVNHRYWPPQKDKSRNTVYTTCYCVTVDVSTCYSWKMQMLLIALRSAQKLLFPV